MIDFNQLPRFKNHQFTLVSLISEWSAAYEVHPDAIERQVAIAHAWCNANPRKAPKKNPVRFLHSWMARAKAYGNLVEKKPTQAFQEQKPDDDDLVTPEMFAELRRSLK